MHGDGGGRSGVDGAGRAELGDGEGGGAGLAGSVAQPGALLAEEQDAGARQRGRLERHRTGQVVDAEQRQTTRRRPGGEGGGVGVVLDVEVAVGDHRAPAVPPTPADDVDGRDVERVRGAHDGADVEVVLPVLDGHVQRVTSGVEVGDDRIDRPVAVAVDDVAAVAVGEQCGVEAGVVGDGADPGADADLVGALVLLAHAPYWSRYARAACRCSACRPDSSRYSMTWSKVTIASTGTPRSRRTSSTADSSPVPRS